MGRSMTSPHNDLHYKNLLYFLMNLMFRPYYFKSTVKHSSLFLGSTDFRATETERTPFLQQYISNFFLQFMIRLKIKILTLFR